MSVSALNLQPQDPMLGDVMAQLTNKSSSMSVAQNNISNQNKVLLAGERKSHVDNEVAKLVNLVSIR